MSDTTEGGMLSPKPLSAEQRRWRWQVLGSTYIGYCGYYLTRKVFTICKVTIAADFGVELSDMAHIWTAFLLAYMLGQFINSFLGRKWGPRVLLLGGLGTSIVFNVVFGFTNSYYTFLVFMFFNGLVQATGWPGVVGGVAQWLRPHERGTIMGFWSTSYLIGNLVVKSMGAFLLGHFGWRHSFLGCTLFTVFIWLLLYLWQRNKPEDVGLDSIVDEESDELRSVQASNAEEVTFMQYLKVATNPVILTMGVSYFCIKFLRYALDSWLPAFLDYQGMTAAHAGYASSIFDLAGFAGAVIAGLALDRIFRGNWAALCFVAGIGMVLGYVVVLTFQESALGQALSFGVVGFMIYGPDTLLCGAASVQVAGERNAVAVAGLVNGIGSIGPVVQEQVIGWLVKGDAEDVLTGMRQTNLLGLYMSIAFVVLMTIVLWRVGIGNRRHREQAD